MAEKYQENATSEVSFDINSSTGEKDPCMDTLCTLIIYCIIVLFKFVSKTKKKKKKEYPRMEIRAVTAVQKRRQKMPIFSIPIGAVCLGS